MDFDIISFIGILLIAILGYLIGKFITNRKWESQIPDIKEDAIKRSRSVIGGQFSEQLAPYLPGFPYLPTEARFIGKPIDLVIFRGMDEKNITEVVFVEVKSGNASLSQHEKRLKDIINEGKVSWFEYRIPKGLTKQETDEK